VATQDTVTQLIAAIRRAPDAADADQVGQPQHDLPVGAGPGLQPVFLLVAPDDVLAAAGELGGVGSADPLLRVGGRGGGGGGAHGARSPVRAAPDGRARTGTVRRWPRSAVAPHRPANARFQGHAGGGESHDAAAPDPQRRPLQIRRSGRREQTSGRREEPWRRPVRLVAPQSPPPADRRRSAGHRLRGCATPPPTTAGSQLLGRTALRVGGRARCPVAAHPCAGEASGKPLLQSGVQRGDAQRLRGQRPGNCRGIAGAPAAPHRGRKRLRPLR
jgi:hypothetical protein